MNLSEFEDAYEDQQRIRGALLNTPLSELSLRTPVVIEADASVVQAVNAMKEHRTGCVLVARGGKLAGIFTERDVLTSVIYRDESQSLKVASVMTANPETLEATATIACALNKMSEGGYRHIPMVDEGGRPAGVVSIRDLVDFLVELFPEGVHNLPPNPDKALSWAVDGG